MLDLQVLAWWRDRRAAATRPVKIALVGGGSLPMRHSSEISDWANAELMLDGVPGATAAWLPQFC